MKRLKQSNFPKGMFIYPLFVLASMAISATGRSEHYYGNTVHVHDFIKLKMNRDQFHQQLTKNNIQYKQESEFFFFKNETFDRYVLTGIPLESGIVHSAVLGIHRKGNKLEVYIEHIEISDKRNTDQAEKSEKENKEWNKKYRAEAISFFNGLDEK